jgi:membrane protein
VAARASATTYSLLFALFPLALALAGAVHLLHLSAAQEGLVASLTTVVPPSVVRLAVQPHASDLPLSTLALAGVLGYLYGMTTAFRRLIEGINRAYGYLPPLRRAGWWTMLLCALLSLTLGFGLVAVLALAALGRSLVRALVPAMGGAAATRAVGGVALLALAWITVAVLYWVAPDRPHRFRWFTPGLSAAIAVWLAISFGFSTYLAHFNSYALLYGGFGAVILLLLYLYFFSYALLLGAEIDAALAARGLVRGAARPPRR